MLIKLDIFNLKFNMSNEIDIIEQRNRFYNTFNMVLRKFFIVREFVFLKLFKTYCCQFYCLELWFGSYKWVTDLNKFAVGFYRAVKKIFRLPDGESNHLVCELSDILTFDHLFNWNKIRFLKNLLFFTKVLINLVIVWFKSRFEFKATI